MGRPGVEQIARLFDKATMRLAGSLRLWYAVDVRAEKGAIAVPYREPH